MGQRRDGANSKIPGNIQWFSKDQREFQNRGIDLQQTILDQMSHEGKLEDLPGDKKRQKREILS